MVFVDIYAHSINRDQALDKMSWLTGDIVIHPRVFQGDCIQDSLPWKPKKQLQIILSCPPKFTVYTKHSGS